MLTDIGELKGSLITSSTVNIQFQLTRMVTLLSNLAAKLAYIIVIADHSNILQIIGMEMERYIFIYMYMHIYIYVYMYVQICIYMYINI